MHVASDSRKNSISYGPGAISSEEVQCTTLDLFTSQQNVDGIDFLKIDTEGHELEVLQGASEILQTQRIRLVLLECVTLPSEERFVSLAAVGKILRQFSSKLFAIFDQQLDWGGAHRLQYCNAMFVSAGVAVNGIRHS